MWQIIAAILGAIFGFGAGSAGLTQLFPQPTVNQPAPNFATNACFQPETQTTLTLKWPDNYKNLTDYRVTLNPSVFSGSEKFDTDYSCHDMIHQNVERQELLQREFIRVRKNVRISSCKTDELAGPYTTDTNTCENIAKWSFDTSKIIRGSCRGDLYPDLRKVAEIDIRSRPELKSLYPDKDILEIFWTPASHNSGCHYDPQRPNCGTGPFLNLREFVFVLLKREAFEQSQPSKCRVLWDAGSINQDACSHYFDVYMAKDLYFKLLSPTPGSDPNWEFYDFFKTAIENCQEQSKFLPLVDVPTLSFPPTFIKTPFVISDFSYQPGKILPEAGNNFQLENYRHFIIFNPAMPNLSKTSLLQTTKFEETNPTICQPPALFSSLDLSATPTVTPTLSPPDDCYVPLGKIDFPKTGSFVTFDVYSKAATPNTFYLRERAGNDKNTYQYTFTERELPAVNQSARTLQLSTLEFGMQNEWTWATPRCKPALYFYPPKTLDLSLKLLPAGKITKKDPPFNRENGWAFTAFPEGKIALKEKNSQESLYPYLYYEAEIEGLSLPSQGFLFSQKELSEKLSWLLKKIGFNEKETKDFLDYWLPRLKEKPYYFVSLLPLSQIEKEEKIIFSQPPETFIRARFIFEGLDEPRWVAPLKEIPSFERVGFVVADWGGTLLGKGCVEKIE